MNADGSGVTRLTDSPGDDSYPAWSPDGTRIAFVSTRDGNPEIYVMPAPGAQAQVHADGSNQVKLRDAGASPAWSPNGDQIAALFRFESLMHLGVMPADGSAEPRPLLTAGTNTSPAWSPDGTRIAFSSAESSADSEIMVINADGSNLVNLTNTPDGVDLRPTWSPDGKQIAFVSDRDGNHEIYVMPADGRGVTRLTNNDAWDSMPSWSP